MHFCMIHSFSRSSDQVATMIRTLFRYKTNDPFFRHKTIEVPTSFVSKRPKLIDRVQLKQQSDVSSSLTYWFGLENAFKSYPNEQLNRTRLLLTGFVLENQIFVASKRDPLVVINLCLVRRTKSEIWKGEEKC